VSNDYPEFDVIVCGFGGAGAAAAIEAHDAGASVLVLEKAETGGGSTAESGGSMATVLDREGAIEHYLTITERRTPREVISAYVDGVLAVPNWLRDGGGQVEELDMRLPAFPRRYPGTAYRNLPHAEAIGPRVRVSEPSQTHGGTTLWNFLRSAVAARGIEVRLGCPVTALVVDDGTVVGVRTGTGTGTGAGRAEISARRGVVLCTGGFGYDSEMLRENVGAVIPAFGPPGRNNGDGIRLAKQAGADLWHMNSVACGFGYQVDGVEAAWMTVMPSFGFLLVDHHGRRFINEATIEHHAANHALIVRDVHSGEFDRLPAYLVFDETTRRAGPIATNEAGANRARSWSPTNLDEVGNGWIRSGGTVTELGNALGIPATTLTGTVERFNHAIGGDDEFGRQPAEMVALTQAPFYAIPVWPALFNTQGGPRRDARARILDVSGRPIPGLYGAGELGSIWGSLYPGAGNVTEAIVFGRIAGRSAATTDREVTS
jgi:succinate dehydrogenase/fumarate reductase flavoprotein subunit